MVNGIGVGVDGLKQAKRQRKDGTGGRGGKESEKGAERRTEASETEGEDEDIGGSEWKAVEGRSMV